MCVQRFDDSRDSAIHITYRISLRSSSLREPRDPLSKVVLYISLYEKTISQIIIMVYITEYNKVIPKKHF